MTVALEITLKSLRILKNDSSVPDDINVTFKAEVDSDRVASELVTILNELIQDKRVLQEMTYSVNNKPVRTIDHEPVSKNSLSRS